jgi:hypothetical protein
VGVGDAGGEVVSFVDEQQRARGIEARLVEEERAVARGEDVVVVADPDVVEAEGGAGDLVGADAAVATGGAQGVEVAGVVFVEVESGEAAPGHRSGDPVVEVGAGSRTQWNVWLTQCSDLLRTCQTATGRACGRRGSPVEVLSGKVSSRKRGRPAQGLRDGGGQLQL